MLLPCVWGGRPRPPPSTWTWASDDQIAIKTKFKGGGRGARPTQALSGGGINAQHLHQVGYLSQMTQCVARGFIVSAEKVGVEHILPGPTAQGPRLNFGQADVAQREHRQRLEQ